MVPTPPAQTSTPASSCPHPLKNGQLKMELETEVDGEDLRSQSNPKLVFGNDNEEAKTGKIKPLPAGDAAGGKIRPMTRRRVKIPQKQMSTTLRLNRRRLGSLLDRLTAAHRWREASAVLSVLFSGNLRSYSPSEDQRNFLIAMELLKRFCGRGNLHNLIKSTYEVWMGKLSWYKKGHKKKQLLQLELALFYLSQGKLAEAHCYTRFLVSDDFGSEPFINLIHGLILYQLWYADLPEEMQLKGFDVHTSDAHGMPLSDGYQETEMCESSNGHDAVDIENTKASSRCSSESSVGYEKILMDRKGDVLRKKSGVAFSVQEFHIDQLEDDEEKGLPINQDNFINTSIYFAPGLDKSLLPIQLKLLAEDPVQSILLYRRLANEKYRDAVKHLRLALHSTPPLFAALLPLIQLLLLGDRVDEAIIEVDKSCHVLDSALPFRLKARLLQCFRSSQITMISRCYENALTKDPTCNYSMENLIKMHKTGNYSAILLLEMLAMHLDFVDGKCSIWEEFASCFLELQAAWLFDHEDCMSANNGGVKDRISSHRIPRMLTEGEARDTWRLRCRWWASRHFSRKKCLSEIQAGEWMLLQFKASCATHLYGPNFEYVAAVLRSLTQPENANKISYLRVHIKNPLNLVETMMAT